jgi:hypothetical protein
MRLRLREADPAAWQRASSELIDEEFCDSVERGEVPDKVAAWR